MANLLLSVCVLIVYLSKFNVECSNHYDLNEKSASKLAESSQILNFNHLHNFNQQQPQNQQVPTTQFQASKQMQPLNYSKSSSILTQANTNQAQTSHNILHLNNYHQSMIKLRNHLNLRQTELVKQNPGSLLAIARALKMAILECQHQMRHEPWDCPIYNFSIKPTEVFGKLMSRSFRETSFVHSLLSAAIAHSIARACTDGMIVTCNRSQTREGGYSENIEFGKEFARQFMMATHGMVGSPLNSLANNLQLAPLVAANSPPLASPSATPSNNQIMSNDINLSNNLIGTGSGVGNDLAETSEQQQQQQQQQQHQNNHVVLATNGFHEPAKREKIIRQLINEHNDELGILLVLQGMRRECKCHGLSGSCNIETCWLKLPPFREVAGKLHDSLDQAVKVIHVNNKQKSLTSASVKKSNKKRSSSSMIPVNDLNLRSSTNIPYLSGAPAAVAASASVVAAQTYKSFSSATYENGNNPLMRDGSNIIGSRKKGANNKRHAQQLQLRQQTPPAQSGGNCQDCHQHQNQNPNQNAPNSTLEVGSSGNSNNDYTTTTNRCSASAASKGECAGGAASGATIAASNEPNVTDNLVPRQQQTETNNDQSNQINNSINNSIHSEVNSNSNSSSNAIASPIKRRPVARSIGISTHVIIPDALDLLYYEESPDFCLPSERYNIKGTKGRICTLDSSNATNNCERLCCGRGYKTEVRIEKYKCECKFQFCCKLDCNICTRRKMIHKCL